MQKKVIATVSVCAIAYAAYLWSPFDEQTPEVVGGASVLEAQRAPIQNPDEQPFSVEAPLANSEAPVDSEHVATDEPERVVHRAPSSKRYYPPAKDKMKYARSLLQAYPEDSTGEVATKLYYLYGNCDPSLSNQEEVERELKEMENSLLMGGQGSGTIQRNYERMKSTYDECKKLESISVESSSLGYLERGVELGDPRALALSAIIEPADFPNWTEEERSAHREKAGKRLHAARAQCDIEAIRTLATGYGAGIVWDGSTAGAGGNPHIERYANTLMLGMVMAGEGETHALQGNHARLQEIARSMDDEATQTAESLGRSLYHDACTRSQ
jgi:hypothetical protein